MALCNITGTIRDSGDNLLNGELWVQLSQAIADVDTAPDSSILPRLFKFTITAGVVNISLRQSETYRTTYRFRFFASSGSPAVLDSDPSIDFYAYVPNQPTVEFSGLLPTGIVADQRDTAIARLAQLLTTNQDYATALRGGPRYLGSYNAATVYGKDDCVAYAGSSWIWISNTPAAGSTPAVGNANWMLAAAQGNPGGTGGTDTAFDPTGWDGATWAPTANAIRDRLVLLATLADPAFSGNPTAPTQAVGNNSTRLATTAFVIAEILARLASSPTLTTPALAATPADTANGTGIASTAFVKNVFHRYSRLSDTKTAGTPGGASIAGTQTRTLNTIDTNAGDVVALTANTFTLRPGTYRIRAIAPAYGCGSQRAFLFNVTTSGRTLNGTSGFCAASSDSTMSEILGTFVCNVNTDFQIRHAIANAVATNGLGVSAGDGNTEIYTVVEIWRLD